MNRAMYLHCENGHRVPLTSDEPIQTIVDRYIDHPFTFINAVQDETTSRVRCIEFLGNLPFKFNQQNASLNRIYTISPKEMKQRGLDSRLRAQFTVHYPTGIAMKTSCAYVPNMFDNL